MKRICLSFCLSLLILTPFSSFRSLVFTRSKSPFVLELVNIEGEGMKSVPILSFISISKAKKDFWTSQ